jgi:hypothetical protein
MAGTDVHQRGKVFDANRSGKVGVYVRRNAPCLPWRKCPAQNASRRTR